MEIIVQLIDEHGNVESESRTSFEELERQHKTGTCGALCGFCYDEYCRLLRESPVIP